MTDQLKAAAEQRHQDCTRRATAALRDLAKVGEPISFASVARTAAVSTDFLYRQPALRTRIEQLRGRPGHNRPAPVPEPESSTSAAVRALSSQLKDLRRRHREEVEQLKVALASAHGENLELRRAVERLAPSGRGV